MCFLSDFYFDIFILFKIEFFFKTSTRINNCFNSFFILFSYCPSAAEFYGVVCRAYMFLIEFLETVATETQSMQKVRTHMRTYVRTYAQGAYIRP